MVASGSAVSSVGIAATVASGSIRADRGASGPIWSLNLSNASGSAGASGPIWSLNFSNAGGGSGKIGGDLSCSSDPIKLLRDPCFEN